MSEANNEIPAVQLSVVIPIFNEEPALPKLFERLFPVLDDLDVAYEVVLVDDGSRDRSPTLLRQQYKLRSDVTRVLLLRSNVGKRAREMGLEPVGQLSESYLGVPMLMGERTLGVIGVGGMGTGDMMGLTNHKEIQTLAVCDPDKNHRDRARQKTRERAKSPPRMCSTITPGIF